MERRVISEAEHRLTILFSLHLLGEVTDAQLLRFMMEYDLMNYFTLQPAIVEMEAQGQLERIEGSIGSMLVMANNGMYVLNEYRQRIPQSKRQLIEAHAPEWQRRFLTEQQMPADVQTLPDGREGLNLRLLEGKGTLLQIVCPLQPGQKITCLSEKWSQSAGMVYQTVTRLLLSDSDGETPELPAYAAIRQQSGQEWNLTLKSGETDAAVILTIGLSDERLAHFAAIRWPDAE